MMFEFTEEEAFSFADAVLEKGKESGTVSNLQYLIAAKEYGSIVVFAERSIEIRMLAQLTEISLWVACGTCVVLLIFSFFLSKWAVRPVQTAFKKQRQFIADASHELKTPLTIIGANIDVLENDMGENTRLAHIRAQCERMGSLIHHLLLLAKADEGSAQMMMVEFDLSKTLRNTALEFESRAFEEGKELHEEIMDNVQYTGDEGQVRQLASILIDNAIRYSDSPGRIEVSLGRENGKILFSVYNTGSGIPAAERERVFDRFYRSDDSRSRETGGYGLGLSIARTIAKAHRGKITITGKAGEWVRFLVYL
jgi:signal transduction histidine kinase